MSLAPITLHTGLPGAGKTLNTLALVEKIGREEGVTVYFNGIPDLRVPGWVELVDATAWHTLPQNSILVIDEAQRVFRPRHTGSSVPEHVEKLETIRHQGIRLVVITQHPKLVDSNLRRLVGKHRHYVRVFGSKLVSCHEWEECKPDPDLGRTDSIKTTVAHPKHVYGWYKSAEVHSIKTRVPKRLLFVLVVPLLVAGLGWFAVSSMSSFGDKDRVVKGAGVESSASSMPTKRGPKDRLQWIADQQPRVPGYAYSAPIYDALAEPKAVPFPVGCVDSAQRCTCYTDQGTPLDVPVPDCKSIAERGFFQFWRDPSNASQQRTEGRQRAPMPMEGSPEGRGGSSPPSRLAEPRPTNGA